MEAYLVKTFGEDFAAQIIKSSVHLLPLLGALAALIVGWLLARFIAWLVFKALCRTTIDDWIVEKMGIDNWLKKRAKKGGVTENLIERSIQKVVYWILLVGVVVAVFDILNIKMISEPLSAMLREITTSVDDLLRAGLILLVALVAAFMVKFFIRTALKRLKFDEKSKKYAPEDAKTSITDTVANIAFYGILFFALAPFLDALKLTALSAPVSNVVERVLSVLPKAAGAIVVFGVGYVISKIVKEIVTNLLVTVGLDKFVEKLGFDKLVKDQSPSRLVGSILQIIILVQLAISGLENLGLKALSDPLTNMLNMMWTYVPKVFGGVLLIIIGVVAGRFIGRIVAKALESISFDKFLRRIGLGVLEEGLRKTFETVKTPSALVGYIVSYVIILLMVGQIFDTLQMTVVAALIHKFLSIYVLKGVIALLIVGIGFIIGNIVRKLIAAHGSEGTRLYFFLGTMVRYVILVFAVTMAASHVGLGDQIVLYTFLLTFGGMCLALALAFGLGGREVAAQIAREQFAKAKSGHFGDVVKTIGASMEESGKKATEEPPPSVDPKKEEPKKEEAKKEEPKKEEPKKEEPKKEE